MKKKNSKEKKFSESRKTDNTLFDLIHKYNELRSIANAIYNSDYYMIATKKEQKEIEAAAVCISKALVSAIGLEAINHDFLPDDSGDDRSWGDRLPDDSGNGTDKEFHDAVKKMMNIAYGKTETDGVKKAAARQALNSIYGATGSHAAVYDEVEFRYTPYKSRYINDLATLNRKNLGEIGAKSPVDVLDEDPSAFGNEYDGTDDDSNGDEVKDYSEVNLGNFADGPFYSDQYRALAIQYGFDTELTLKQIEKLAAQYYIQMINLVDVVDSQDEITADKYTLEPGSVFFITNKNDSSKSPVFVLIYMQPYTKTRSSDISRFSFEITPEHHTEESPKTNYIDFIGSDAYFNIGKVHLNQNTIIDLDATLEKIKDEARRHGIDTITFVDTIRNGLDIYTEGKYTLEPGSLFFVKGGPNLLNFILITKVGDTDTLGRTRSRFIECVPKMDQTTNLDDIEFIGIDDYYKIDKARPNSTIIDLDTTLTKIKERARAKNIKTITFVGIIKGFYEIFYKCKSYQAGSLLYIKNDERPRFILITGTIDYVNLPQYEHIDPVVVFKTDDSEDESDSKEDGIEAVEAEDEIVDSDEASSDHCINDQYADVDTSKLNHDIYAGISFSIFMKPTESGKYVNFADICDIYDFDVSETIKRIKNVAYQENIGSIRYVDTIWSRDEIFRKDENDRYVYGNGSLFLMVNYTNAGKDPYFVILRKMWDGHVSEYISTLYRINPVMKSAKINSVKEIKVIDDYADGNVRIAKDLKNIISIDYDYKIKEICEKRNYDYEKMISCLKAVTAIIGGGIFLTFEGTVESLKSIVTVDPVVAYDTCSVFFVSAFIDGAEGPYFVIYMPITGKTKNGYSFRLYRIRPILKQDPNTDFQDDSNVREINQFTTIHRANSEVREANKDAYMKIEFSLINHSDGGEIQSFSNICYTWKFKFYDTIKRIRFVAYMNKFKEIKYAGTACSHEEILEKEVIYSNGSVLFVCDEEDPHFVIVEFINGSTCLNRINPVKE